MNIYITSDTHYGHANISGPEVSRWPSGYRDFESVHKMNTSIVESINKYVGENDILYHLGDWSFGGVKNILKFRSQLICKNIHLILGNHDENITDKEISYEGGTFNPVDLFSSIQDVLMLKKYKFFMSHYSHRVWPGSHKGVIHLYGHSHGNIEDYGKSMDVGIDSAYKFYGEYRPFHINDIYEIMSKREIFEIDHHKKD